MAILAEAAGVSGSEPGRWVVAPIGSWSGAESGNDPSRSRLRGVLQYGRLQTEYAVGHDGYPEEGDESMQYRP